MINLERFNNMYVIQIVEIRDGRTVRELGLTADELQNGILSEIFEDEDIERISKDQVEFKGGIYNDSFEETDNPIICNVFVNGLIVRDLENELNI